MENIAKIALAVSGATLVQLLGGLSMFTQVLIVLIIVDYATGLIASGINGELNSKVGFKGLLKKMFIVMMIAVGHAVDQLVGNGGEGIRDTVVTFYAINELISILENAGRSGVPVPDKLRDMIAVLQTKKESDKK